jgi:hypothetical protein
MDIEVRIFIPDIDESRCSYLWNEIKKEHKNNLEKKGVILPKADFSIKGYPKVTAKAYWLIALFNYIGECMTIHALSDFSKRMTNEKARDTQQVRHTATQDGWNILVKNDIIPGTLMTIPYQCHLLVDVLNPKPYYTPKTRMGRQSALAITFEEQKKLYNYECATCRSKEGEPIRGYSATICRLTQGHKDPEKPLTDDNRIPQCQACNMSQRKNWVFDDNGRVKTVASECVIRLASPLVKEKILKYLITSEPKEVLKRMIELFNLRLE